MKKKNTSINFTPSLFQFGKLLILTLVLTFIVTSFTIKKQITKTNLSPPPPTYNTWVYNSSNSEIIVDFYIGGSHVYGPSTLCPTDNFKFPTGSDEIRVHSPGNGATAIYDYNTTLITVCNSCWSWNNCATGSGNGNIEGRYNGTTIIGSNYLYFWYISN